MFLSLGVPIAYQTTDMVHDSWWLIAIISIIGAFASLLIFYAYLGDFHSYELNDFFFRCSNFRKREEWEDFERWLYVTNNTINQRYCICDDNVSYLYLVPGFKSNNLPGNAIPETVIKNLKQFFTIRRTVFYDMVHYDISYLPEITK